MLRAACPDTKKPIETFHVDMLAYYQELFRLMTLKPDLKAERLYADFMMGKISGKLWRTARWMRRERTSAVWWHI